MYLNECKRQTITYIINWYSLVKLVLVTEFKMGP